MRKIALLAAGILLACMQPAAANRPACDLNPSVSCYEAVAAPERAQRARPVKPHYNVKRKARPDDKQEAKAPETRGGLVGLQCGPSRIRVASTARVQFQCFCDGLRDIYKFTHVGGWRPGKCWQGGKHPCGGAIDVEQKWRCQSADGRCLPRAFPVSASERIADRCGLQPGSRWGYRDVGHFETKGTLVGSNWPENKIAQIAVAAVTRLLPADPQPPHPLLGTYQVAGIQSEDFMIMPREDFSPVPSLDTRVMTALSWSIYNEYQPRERAVDRLLAPLRGVPVGTAREEIARVSAMTGIPYKTLLAFAKIESDFDCRQVTKSYVGLFQLSHPKSSNGQNEFGRYGPTRGDVKDCRDNAMTAGYKFLIEGAFFEHATGRWPNFKEMYMIHQQGLGGATEHYARPDRLAWQSMCATQDGKEKGEGWCKVAIWGNVPSDLKARYGSVDHITSGQFTAMWDGRVDRYASLDLSIETPAVERPHVKRKPQRHYRKHGKRHRHRMASR